MASIFKKWAPYIALPTNNVVIRKHPIITYLLLSSIVIFFIFQNMFGEPETFWGTYAFFPLGSWRSRQKKRVRRPVVSINYI